MRILALFRPAAIGLLAAAASLAAGAACSVNVEMATPADGGSAGATTTNVPPVTTNNPTSPDAGATTPVTKADAGTTPSGPPATSEDASTVVTGTGTDTTIPGWTLTWSDEFDGPDNSAVDSTKWNQETGNSGWANNQELEYYTAGTANAIVTGGSLVITASTQGASALKCGYGTCQYTSARFNTQGKFSQAYGLFESRIQIPRGQGIWPAFWTLGNNIGSAGWPKCGEIDIMENVGKQPATNHGSLHGPGYSGGSALTASIDDNGGAALADDFHVYDIEWAPNVVRFYMDGSLYETRTPADVPAGDTWVYDHEFFVILNVAVGGNFPGNPDGTSTFPQTMKVDYVRVYKSDGDAG